MSQPAESKPPRPLWRTLLIVLGGVVALLVLVIEIGSRVCDGIVASRKKDPAQYAEMMKKSHEPDLVEKLSYGVLYGVSLFSM